jgi:hypothetical protein
VPAAEAEDCLEELTEVGGRCDDWALRELQHPDWLSRDGEPEASIASDEPEESPGSEPRMSVAQVLGLLGHYLGARKTLAEDVVLEARLHGGWRRDDS